jgi:ABC-type proline/glycine betaine transport system ATPase subunit
MPADIDHPYKIRTTNYTIGGMQKRVGLARELVTDTGILLMDELIELQARLDKTILFVSHDLSEAMKIGRHNRHHGGRAY